MYTLLTYNLHDIIVARQGVQRSDYLLFQNTAAKVHAACIITTCDIIMLTSPNGYTTVCILNFVLYKISWISWYASDPQKLT